ncbi:DUF397 domain-containing protein [Streptomyces antibioticus]|uniref:DUF397 domain-containing protein n=1 Tax=Streptomyces antibioticus TaxID=1890 RepID=UPI0037112B00
MNQNLVWFKSSYSSGAEADSCVEVAVAPAAIHIRDSKVADGPQLALAPAAWTKFVAYTGR